MTNAIDTKTTTTAIIKEEKNISHNRLAFVLGRVAKIKAMEAFTPSGCVS